MSKSLRLSNVLIEAAAAVGRELSRSTAQQVEYWARLGRALEERGLTIDTALAILRHETVVDEKEIWANKRRLQKRDIALVESGRVKQSDMYLFTSEMARSLKIVNGPY